ncbi:MAG: BtpA/SgcQ family protein [Chloroflexota bacterium]
MVPSNKKFFPVIHVKNRRQALKNALLAYEAGSDGLFLINHENEDGIRELDFRRLLDIHSYVTKHMPSWFVGVNCLDLPAREVFQHLNPSVAAVWADNAEIDERSEAHPEAEQILAAKTKSGWRGQYFGGVASKYQRPIANHQLAASIGQNYMDVVTTSGPSTGQAASIQKIQDMKQAIQPAPLAIASGITAKNVNQFLPWVDYFLVATGISRSFYQLDPVKTKELAQIIHQSL